MREGFSIEDKQMLELLSEELQGKTVSKKHEETDWQKLLLRAECHKILALFYNRIEAEEIAEEERKVWLCKTRCAALQSYHLLFTAKYVVELLEANHIPCVLLKGLTIASCYSVPELRKSGDVDVLILDKTQKKKAETLLEEKGFRKSKEQHGSHHTVWYSPEYIEVEIHTRLIELFTGEAANKKMDELFAEIPEHICRKEIMGINFPVLEDGFQAYHLLLHMLVHYMHSGFGMRLLCDWVVFWNRTVEEKEREGYKRLVLESGLQKFSDMITSICVYFIGLENPMLGECVAREAAEAFLRDVLEAEEFGKSDSDRLVVLNGTGFFSYVKEFHHQMKMNYPRAGKVWLCWPVLWFCTLARFVTNNHKLRRTTSWRVIRKTHARSKRIKELQLFQNV